MKLEQGRLYEIEPSHISCIWLGFRGTDVDINYVLSDMITYNMTNKEVEERLELILLQDLESIWYTVDSKNIEGLTKEYLTHHNFIYGLLFNPNYEDITPLDKCIDIDLFYKQYLTSCLKDGNLGKVYGWESFDTYYDKYYSYAMHVRDTKHKIYEKHKNNFKPQERLKGWCFAYNEQQDIGYILNVTSNRVYFLDFHNVTMDRLFDYLVDIETSTKLDWVSQRVASDFLLSQLVHYDYFSIGSLDNRFR